MKKHAKKIIILVLFFGAIALLRAFGAADYLTFANLKLYQARLTEFVAANYWTASAAFVGIYIVVTAFSIPGAGVMSLTGGLLFGLAGIVHVNIGATTGAVLAFLAARNVLGEYVQDKYGERLASFNRELEKNGKNYLLTLRLIPVFPFFLINLFAGLTKIPLWRFAWTTAVGIIPGSFAYVYAGTRLGSIRGTDDIFTWQMLMVFVLFGLLALLPVVIKKIQGRRKAKAE